MKNILLLLAIFLSISGNAQVGINNADPKAQLHVTATSQTELNGILIPQSDEFPTTVTADQDSMILFITGNGSVNKGYWYYDHGVGWKKLLDSDTSNSLQAYVNPKFPDGLRGLNPITIPENQGFTVPAGKNLYITTAFRPNGLGNIAVLDASTGNVFFLISNSRATEAWPTFNNPILIGQGDSIVFSSFAFNGFLVDATVEPIYATGTYTVPAGKIFVFLTSNNGSSNNPIALVQINGIRVNRAGSNNSRDTSVEPPSMPIFVDELQTISIGFGDNFNGYLIDK